MELGDTIANVYSTLQDTEAGELIFRAITTPSGRHGIRLEKAYWKAFNEIAKRCGETTGELTEKLILSGGNEKKNLTARIRLFCLLWQSEQLSRIEQLGGERLATSLVKASVQPAIALSAEKRLIASNDHFLRLVRSGFTVQPEAVAQSDLRLSLDHPLQEVIGQLIANGNQPLNIGVAMGMADQRVRRTMNALLIGSGEAEIVVGFIV